MFLIVTKAGSRGAASCMGKNIEEDERELEEAGASQAVAKEI